MGLLSANMLAKLQSGTGTFAWLLELDLPGGMKRYSRGGYPSAYAWYDDRVVSWGRNRKALSDPRGGEVPARTTTVKVRDEDGELARIIRGVNRDSVEGSAATILLAETSLAHADWYTTFTGILVDWDPQARVWDLTLRTDDLPLDAHHTAPLTQSDWPGAASATWGKEAPRLYGKHSSLGSTSGGMVPTLIVDVARFRYLVCAGYAKSVDRVYVDGTEVTTGWTVDHPVVNGRLYTVVTFTTDQGESPVTVDAKGYEAVGDGSGALIENPAEQIAHALNNWVYGQYRTGAWLTGAPISSSALTTCAAYFTRKGLKGGGYISNRIRGHEMIAGWLKTWGARGWWTNFGELALGIEDHVITDVYPSTVYRQDRHDIEGSFKIDYMDDRVQSINVHHMYSGTLGQYVQTLTVRDAAVSREAEETLDMVWSYASAA